MMFDDRWESDLIREIEDQHLAAWKSADVPAVHARDAGLLLSKAKARLPNNAWTAWLERNFAGPAQLAETYIQLASRWDEVMRRQHSARIPSTFEAISLVSVVNEPYLATSTPEVARLWITRAIGQVLNWGSRKGFRRVHRFGRWMAKLDAQQFGEMMLSLDEPCLEHLLHSARYHAGLTPLDTPNLEDVAYAILVEGSAISDEP